MKTSHSLRVRVSRWEEIEKKAWALSMKAHKIIKPTDIADHLLSRDLENVTIEDIEKTKSERS